MPLTREEERLRKREYRRRKREEAAASGGTGGTVLKVAPAAAEPEPASTKVQEAVETELASLAASAAHPGLAATAMAMAEILDDPKSKPQWPGAARSLTDSLMRLHDANKGRGGGKLAAMRQARGAS